MLEIIIKNKSYKLFFTTFLFGKMEGRDENP